MDPASSPRLPIRDTEDWFRLLRDHLLQPDVTPNMAANRMGVTRNTVIGMLSRAKNSASAKLRLVCTAEEWRTILANRERRVSGAPRIKAPRQDGSLVSTAPARYIPGGNGTYGRGPGAPRPPRMTPLPPSSDQKKWAKEVEGRLQALSLEPPRPLEPCCHPGDNEDRVEFCGKDTVAKLFGGRPGMTERLRALGTPPTRYCVLHTHVVLASSGKAAFERAIEEALAAFA